MSYPEELIDVILPLKDDKYGVTEQSVEKILAVKPDILITLDCGSANKDTLEKVKNNLADVLIIVIDHHFIPEREEEYPQVDAFINPKKLNEFDSSFHLCTAGLAIKFIQALSYSFTKEYNIVNKLISENKEDVVFIQNGCLSTEAEYIKSSFQREVFFGDSNEVNVSSNDNIKKIIIKNLWDGFIKTNRDFYFFNQFLSKSKVLLSVKEKFNIIQNLSMQNIFNKISPYLGFAAIGTVGDSMPLYDDNRIFVKEGLSILNRKKDLISSGLKELLKHLKLHYKQISEQDIGFSLSPTINAAGRLGETDKSFDALIENDPLKAAEKSFILKSLNEKRKEITTEALVLIEPLLEQLDKDQDIAIVYNSNIHQGISGLLASKIAEQLQKPAIVLVDDGESLRGSIRAFTNENVFSILESLKDMFIQFGGHKQAAGFSLEFSKKDKFIEEAYKMAKNLCGKQDSNEVDDNNLEFFQSYNMKETEINSNLWKEALTFSPYGKFNPHPLFGIESDKELQYTKMPKNKDHARIDFNILNKDIKAVWFFHNNQLDEYKNTKEKIYYAEPHYNFFMGKTTPQLIIKNAEIKK